MKNIYNLTREQLINFLETKNEKSFKAQQIFEWLYQKKITDFSEMTNISKPLQTMLCNEFSMKTIKIVTVDKGPEVAKFLLELVDQNRIEAVVMEHDYGLSLCVSSQVGCNMGCAFCESGRLKKVRNLNTHEMVEQVLLIEDYIKSRISSVVIMGIGEPFDNYENVLNFIKIINDAKGLAIGSRHITVSTCGIVPKIKEFSEENFQVNLAISLHAPNDELRNQIMPINKVYNICQLIKEIKAYIAKTDRRVTLEYVMLKHINDDVNHAKELAKLIKGMNVYVNLIPYNETTHLKYQKSGYEEIQKFYNTLKKHNINVTIRREFGSNINAACGQLRSNEVI